MKSIDIKDGEELVCVIAAGRVEENKNTRESLVSRLSGGKLSVSELLKEKDRDLPLWVTSGIEAARLAPSSANWKPVRYRYQDGSLSAFIAKKNHGAEEIDLGISMAHFELGVMQEGLSGIWEKNENGFSFELNS